MSDSNAARRAAALSLVKQPDSATLAHAVATDPSQPAKLHLHLMSDVFVGIPPTYDVPANAASGRESNPELNPMTSRSGCPSRPKPSSHSDLLAKPESISESGSSILSLVIVTFGLWSPWAKICKRRFFLRHTWVAGAILSTNAEPWLISAWAVDCWCSLRRILVHR